MRTRVTRRAAGRRGEAVLRPPGSAGSGVPGAPRRHEGLRSHRGIKAVEIVVYLTNSSSETESHSQYDERDGKKKGYKTRGGV